MWRLNAGGVTCCEVAFHPRWSGTLIIIVVSETKKKKEIRADRSPCLYTDCLESHGKWFLTITFSLRVS